MTDDAALAQALDLEHQVWRALVDGDSDADGRLLADDFLGVYPSGFAGRSDHIDQLRGGPSVERYDLRSARVRALGDDALLLCYEAVYRRPGRDADEQMYVTSLWERRDGSWINTFSQDTVADAHQGVP